MICSARRDAIEAMADYFMRLPKPDSTECGPTESKDTNP
jgi:hypothetical protein